MHRTEGDNFTRGENGEFLFTDGPPATVLEAAWANSIQEEIAGVIEAAGIQLYSKTKDARDQLNSAINILINREINNSRTSLLTAANYTITDIDGYFAIFTTATATITLPTLSANLDREISIFKSFSTIGAVTVDGEGSETINGEATQLLNNFGDCITLKASSSEWKIINDTRIKNDFNWILNPIGIGMIDDYGLTGTTNSSGDYLINRWKQTDSLATDPTFDKSTDKIKLTSNSTETQSLSFLQLLHSSNYNRLVGQTITVSAKVTSNNSNCRLLVSEDDGSTFENTPVFGGNYKHSGGGSEELLSVTFTVGSSPSGVNVYIGLTSDTNGAVSISSSDYVEFRHCILTISDKIIEHSPRNNRLEHLLCMAYYLRISGSDSEVFGTGFGLGGGGARILIPTPVPMIGNPTPSTSGSTAIVYGGGSSYTESAIALHGNKNNSGVTVLVSGGTISSEAVVYASGNGATILILDAEL